jgi:hypothetical protein
MTTRRRQGNVVCLTRICLWIVLCASCFRVCASERKEAGGYDEFKIRASSLGTNYDYYCTVFRGGSYVVGRILEDGTSHGVRGKIPDELEKELWEGFLEALGEFPGRPVGWSPVITNPVTITVRRQGVSVELAYLSVANRSWIPGKLGSAIAKLNNCVPEEMRFESEWKPDQPDSGRSQQ